LSHLGLVFNFTYFGCVWARKSRQNSTETFSFVLTRNDKSCTQNSAVMFRVQNRVIRVKNRLDRVQEGGELNFKIFLKNGK